VQNGGVLQAIIVASTVVGLIGWPRVRVRSGWGHPGVWLLGVTAVIYLNQVLFTIYVLRVHNGDTSFIAKYLPDGWFALADLHWLADHFPAPSLLSLSVLRIQSFFELPFVVLALLTVCRWFGLSLYRRVAGSIWSIAVFYTATFCLIELSLKNPYTWDDVAIRIVSAVVVGLIVPKLTGPQEDRVTSAKDLALFLLSVGAVGVLILVVYDTALLYNLGHLGRMLPLTALAAAALAVVRLAARQTGTSAGPGTATLTRTVHWFLAYFAVPALAIRYGLIFGAPLVAAAAGGLITAMALYHGAREVAKSRAWAAEMAAATLAGVAGSYFGYRIAIGYPEFRLLVATAMFCVIAVTTCAVVDRARAAK
jgi:hypothetical protein